MDKAWLTNPTIEPVVANIDDLYGQVGQCQRCSLHKTATRAVPGAGRIDAELMFVGEAPGRHEDEQGLPFVGQAGKLLDKMLGSIQIERNEVYIANVIKHRPPNNRDPEPGEIEACTPWLRWQLRLIKPKVIATLGRFSMNLFLPEVKISQAHGRAYQVGAFTIFPLYHPAAALRNGSMMAALQADFLSLGKLLDQQEVALPVELTDLGKPDEAISGQKQEPPEQMELL